LLTVPGLILFLSQDIVASIKHLNSEGFTIPGIDGPDSTTEHDLCSTWMLLLHVDGSPELSTLTTLAMSTKVLIALASFLSGSAVALPKCRRIIDTVININDSSITSLTKLIDEAHITVTNGLIASSLI